MAVTVRLFAAARSAAATDSAPVAPGSLSSVITELLQRFPGLEDVLPRCSFLINGLAVHGNPDEVTIADGAELDVLPPFAGG